MHWVRRNWEKDRHFSTRKWRGEKEAGSDGDTASSPSERQRCPVRAVLILLCFAFAMPSRLLAPCTEMKSRERRSQPDRRADGRTDEGEEGLNLERSKTRQGGRNERIGEIIRAQRCFLLMAFLFHFCSAVIQAFGTAFTAFEECVLLLLLLC